MSLKWQNSIICSILATLSLYGGAVRSEDINDRITIEAISGEAFGAKLINPIASCYDPASGETLIADAGAHSIVVFDQKLNVKFSFKLFADVQGNRRIASEPRGVAVNANGEIFVADNLRRQIDIVDFRGRLLEQIDPAKALGDTSLSLQPQALTFDEAYNLYVLLSGDLRCVQVFNSNLEFVRLIGSSGSDSAHFDTPLALHVARGRLYVTDLYATPAVKVFDTSGLFLFGFAGHDIDRPDLSFPSDVSTIVPDSGRILIWVSDGLRQTIKVYDSNGNFMAMVGGYGIRPGEFQYPSSMTSINDSSVCVSERGGKRLQIFTVHSINQYLISE